MENQESNTNQFTPTDETPVFFTAKAIEAIKGAIAQEGKAGDGLRVSVVGGGCAGFQYSLDFEKDPRMDDLTMVVDGVRIFIDSVSVGYLTGTIIDHVSGLQGTGFKFSNPNARRTCGCGHSFN